MRIRARRATGKARTRRGSTGMKNTSTVKMQRCPPVMVIVPILQDFRIPFSSRTWVETGSWNKSQAVDHRIHFGARV
jgi:hypothetical protein